MCSRLLRRLGAAILAIGAIALWPQPARAQQYAPTISNGDGLRLDSGRFTVVADRRDVRLMNATMRYALARDTFPGLPRSRAHVLIAIAPTPEIFRAWVGPGAPEWGAAIAIPDERRIIMQGAYGNSDAGDPEVVLRHELAHLALHDYLGNTPPRWFDEGYASLSAAEWSRTTALETSVSMAWRSLPDADALNAGFFGGASRAQYTYALSHLAVAELQAIDQQRGLANFFEGWKKTGSYDRALRQAYGMTAQGFDAYWHQRVRRQYGALAFVANLSLAFSFIGLALGPLYWSKRSRNHRRLEIMRAAEAVQEAAARRSALLALLALEGATVDAQSADGRIMVSPGSLDTRGGQV